MNAAERPAPPTATELERWGLNPEWSRILDNRWHVLDTAPAEPIATLVCVHGNPTWAYAWATLLRRLGASYRVVAIDQLGMGYSERESHRSYVERVSDLDEVLGLLDVDTSLPLYLAAHDWGGAITMGWAVDHVGAFDGLILCNTGIAVPEGRSAPALIRLAGSRPFRQLLCRRTPIFVESATRLSGKRLSAIDREAFRAPYRKARMRSAIADFVGDVPLRPGHRSEAALSTVADRLGSITAPVLLVWGAADPVFNDDFATDLMGRFSTVSLHRFAQANHLVMAEADVAGVVEAWLHERHQTETIGSASRAGLPPAPDLWASLQNPERAERAAIVDVASGSSITFGEFAHRVEAIAAELQRRGLQRGDRVAMLTPPGVELLAAVYGVWRAGGVTVVADRGLGLRGLGAAVRSARASWLIGPRAARTASTVLRWSPRATAVDIDDLMKAPPAHADHLAAGPTEDDEVAVLFTSGATGPAKGVRYRYGQLLAQCEALRHTYSITDDDSFVAAFAPFALYGPALGISTSLPDCDVTSPGKLTARALSDAVSAVNATMVFASPAALANVVATAGKVSTGTDASAARRELSGVRLVLSAGAPVPVETLRAVAMIAPNAELHTPYGMTEVLPVADVDLVTIEQQRGDGVCVGYPVEGATVRVDDLGLGVGEILVRAPWVSDGYDRLWAVEHSARPVIDGSSWHRTGDVGHLDAAGRLWVEGRSVHVISTAAGPVTPVPVERAVEQGLPCVRSAAVGVGPQGCQQLVVVLEGDSNGLATVEITRQVRNLVSPDVAAVLTLQAIPVDIRHNAKVDRTAVAKWAEDVLAGRRAQVPG